MENSYLQNHHLDHFKKICQKIDDNEKQEDIETEFKNLFSLYMKLFREYSIILKISDGMEHTLHSVQNELKEKNIILQDRALHLKKLVDEKIKEIKDLNFALVNALESANLENDSLTGDHIKRVSKYSIEIAGNLNLDNDFIERLELYASLHDVGKVGIPESILKKPDQLTDKEYNIMKKHTIIGARMLKHQFIDVMAKNIAFYHHEHWDGSGYPIGLVGENIPLEARIVAVADVFDALISKRYYKEGFSFDEVFNMIVEKTGTHFDPEIVKAFVASKGKLLFIIENYEIIS